MLYNRIAEDAIFAGTYAEFQDKFWEEWHPRLSIAIDREIPSILFTYSPRRQAEADYHRGTDWTIYSPPQPFIGAYGLWDALDLYTYEDEVCVEINADDDCDGLTEEDIRAKFPNVRKLYYFDVEGYEDLVKSFLIPAEDYRKSDLWAEFMDSVVENITFDPEGTIEEIE